MYSRQIIKKLEEWKARTNRKPLIIRGARQVGKTTCVNMFSEQFEQYIYLNLEKEEDRVLFEKSDDISQIVQSIFMIKNKFINRRNTLLFIDEIQYSPAAIKLLRYFYEDYKELYVIAAGSLLESVLKFNQSFPVGRVEFLYLFPFTFREYLLASGNAGMIEAIDTIPFPASLSRNAVKLFSEYLLIGGMPEVVSTYLRQKDVLELSTIYESLLVSYVDDIEKYARGSVNANILRHVLRNSFTHAGKRITFNGFGNSNYKTREMKDAFLTLEKTMILRLLYPTTSNKPPANLDVKKSPKLMVVDTGLVNYFAGLQKEFFLSNSIDDLYGGVIAEHITGQEIAASVDSIFHQPTFWVRDVKQSSAEVDFVIQYEDKLIPIEVKSGKAGRLRSLMQFVDAAPHNFTVRIYSGELSLQKMKTISGNNFILLNLPFYLLGKLNDYIGWMISRNN